MNTFLKNVKERALLRIGEGRARAIDLLALSQPSYGACTTNEFYFKDSIITLLETLKSDQEWRELQTDLENVPSCEYWDKVRFIVEGFPRYKNSQELLEILQDKAVPELESMLEKAREKVEDEYWQQVKFLLTFLLNLHYLEDSRKASFHSLKKDIGIEAYKRRKSNTTISSSIVMKSGYDNCEEALEWARRMGESPMGVYASKSPSAAAVIPRFHAKVFMAIPWTRHNRSFYDAQNPPQAIPIGYEFFLFFPRLTIPSPNESAINGTCPKYVVEVLNEDSCLLWIHLQSDLYKSVAFKIKREEWDRGTWGEDGFCSQYDAPLLHIRFWLKGKRNMRQISPN